MDDVHDDAEDRRADLRVRVSRGELRHDGHPLGRARGGEARIEVVREQATGCGLQAAGNVYSELSARPEAWSLKPPHSTQVGPLASMRARRLSLR